MRIENIARIAKSHFGNLTRFAYGLNRFIHIVETVQAVKDTEYINTVFCRKVNKVFNNIVRITRITDGIRAADKHL